MTTPPTPNFFIVGAPKAGTTALYEALKQHPDIFMPGYKEPHYFSHHLSSVSWSEYLQLFQNATESRLGEASTNYLYDLDAPAKIYQTLGLVKIIVMLRHPVDQIYSMYQHNCRNGQEDVDFETALSLETDRIANNENPMLYYCARAKYSPQIERYLVQFGCENVYIGLFDELQTNPTKLISEIYEFLDVNPNFEPTIRRVNFHGKPRSRWVQALIKRRHPLKWPARFLSRNFKNYLRRTLRDMNTKPTNYGDMDDSLRQKLRAEFSDDIRATANLVQKNLLEIWL